MNSDLGLLTFVEEDIAGAKFYLSRKTDVSLNLAAYHTQQAIEKIVKALVNLSGVEYPRTHDVDLMIPLINSEIFKVPDWVVDGTALFLKWEASARYKTSPVTVYTRVQKYLELTEQWLHDIHIQLQKASQITHKFE
jgi:HEPN domain-containing protein